MLTLETGRSAMGLKVMEVEEDEQQKRGRERK